MFLWIREPSDFANPKENQTEPEEKFLEFFWMCSELSISDDSAFTEMVDR